MYDWSITTEPMKFVKKTISLPEEDFRYAQKRAARIAKETSRPANVSGLISTLLQNEKKREEQTPALKKAA